MNYIILSAHGKIASESLNVLKTMGMDTANIYTIDVLKDTTLTGLLTKYKKIFNEMDLNESDEVLFVVDIIGGSPFNVAKQMCDTNIHNSSIITGFNLPVLITITEFTNSVKSILSKVNEIKQIHNSSCIEYKNK